MRLRDRQILPYRLDLRVPFRGLRQRRGCLISGTRGWGEFAPFDDYPAAADARWLACALEQADGRWPQPVRDRVEVNAIVPAVAPELAAAMALDSGCRTVKVKVGDAAGRARVAAVRGALPDVRIRVDVNGMWDVPQARRALAELAEYGLEYAEQPVRTFEEMVELRPLVDVPLAADELIRVDRRFDDLAEAADVAVLKAAPMGGAAALLHAAGRIGLPVVVSSALDSSLGLAASVAAACALPEPPLACGLGTGVLFAQDTCEPLVPRAGAVARGDYPEPGEFPVVADDTAFWRDRATTAARVGGLPV